MKTVKRYVCSSCDKIIEPMEGLIFQGNVYLISENIMERGGLIGNNLKENIIQEVCYCKSCTKNILKLNNEINSRRVMNNE